MYQYHFKIIWLNNEKEEEEFYFHTYRDLSGLGVDYSCQPEEYLLFGAILIAERGKIEKMIKKIK